jgi:hypothetical protein
MDFRTFALVRTRVAEEAPHGPAREAGRRKLAHNHFNAGGSRGPGNFLSLSAAPFCLNSTYSLHFAVVKRTLPLALAARLMASFASDRGKVASIGTLMEPFAKRGSSSC